MKKIISIFAIIGLITLPIYAQDTQTTDQINTQDTLLVSGEIPNAVITESNITYILEAGTIINGNLDISGNNVKLIIQPGPITINGDLIITGQNLEIQIGLHEDGTYGNFIVKGAVQFNQDSPPRLYLDNESPYFNPNIPYTIFKFNNITGPLGDTPANQIFYFNDTQVIATYTDNSLTITPMRVYVREQRSREAFRTPTIDITPDLIDPTSTGPSNF